MHGITITRDNATKVIALAKTLQDKIALVDNKIDKVNVANNLTTTEADFVLDARQGKALQDQSTSLNGSLKTNIPLLVKYIDDTKMVSQNPKYFADLQQGMFVYFLLCPTGESVFGFSLAENNGRFFGCQILITGYSTDVKVRNCAWTTEWSEWKSL